VLVACTVAGVAAWLGAASQDSGVGLAQLLKAGVNIAGPALFVLGVGMLVYGARPRLASPVAYGLVVWSFLVEIVAGSTSTNHWLLDTSVLSHITPVPAAPPDWLAVGVLAGLGLVAALVGLVLFDRRDLASA
jgi:ABC-2 type transport system permease protein